MISASLANSDIDKALSAYSSARRLDNTRGSKGPSHRVSSLNVSMFGLLRISTTCPATALTLTISSKSSLASVASASPRVRSNALLNSSKLTSTSPTSTSNLITKYINTTRASSTSNSPHRTPTNRRRIASSNLAGVQRSPAPVSANARRKSLNRTVPRPNSSHNA